jgi:ribonuclease-3
LEISGDAHAQQFTVECSAGTLHTVAAGDSRRKAEQEAARQLLALMT